MSSERSTSEAFGISAEIWFCVELFAFYTGDTRSWTFLNHCHMSSRARFPSVCVLWAWNWGLSSTQQRHRNRPLWEDGQPLKQVSSESKLLAVGLVASSTIWTLKRVRKYSTKHSLGLARADIRVCFQMGRQENIDTYITYYIIHIHEIMTAWFFGCMVSWVYTNTACMSAFVDLPLPITLINNRSVVFKSSVWSFESFGPKYLGQDIDGSGAMAPALVSLCQAACDRCVQNLYENCHRLLPPRFPYPQ